MAVYNISNTLLDNGSLEEDMPTNITIYGGEVWREYPTFIRISATVAAAVTCLIGLCGK